MNSNIQFNSQFPTTNNLQMLNNQNMMGGNFVNMNPQIQYIPMPIVPNNSNNEMIQYPFQPIFPLQQMNFNQQIPVFPYTMHNTQMQPIQYVYQQPVYIMPMLPNVVEMQPMGQYKNNNNINQQINNNNRVVNNNNNKITSNNRTVNNKVNNVSNINNNNINNMHLHQHQPIVNNNNNINHNHVSMTSSKDTQKRCINCGSYYKEMNNNNKSCRYHTGQFVSSRVLSAISKWSCCRQFDKNALGCKIECHVEDLKTSQILSQFDKHQKRESQMMDFPPSFNNPSQNNLNLNTNLYPNPNLLNNLNNDLPNPSSSEQKEGILIDIPQLYPSSTSSSNNNNQNVSKNIHKLLEENNEKPLVKDQNGYYIIDHQVQMDDTLQSLAIYYSTTVNDIKFLNNLFSNDIFLRKNLKIRTKVPQNKIKPHVEETKEHKELRLIRRFILFTNAKPEEARYYLINNDWDVKLAVSEFKQDRSFESKFSNVDDQIRKVSKKNF